VVRPGAWRWSRGELGRLRGVSGGTILTARSFLTVPTVPLGWRGFKEKPQHRRLGFSFAVLARKRARSSFRGVVDINVGAMDSSRSFVAIK